ncbi:MAG: TIGR02757 family protein [Candidatus Gastranaerophilales bacterium]|nr:TIGR02757 family protein [Candidatus Gastranaerophilales bacterium]
MITKTELDELVKKYETEDFIKDDPVQFIHKYKNKADIELAGFIASLFSYGNRQIFIKKINELLGYSDGDLYNYIKNGDFCLVSKNNFNYRFSKDFEVIEMLKILSKLYNNSNGLSELFEYGYQTGNSIVKMFQIVIDYFYSNVSNSVGQGFYHLLPDPSKGGAMKRMNMFLRWMIRKPPVDTGIWSFIPKSELLIPLDVHVARISRKMGLLARKSNDMKAVQELTNNLKYYDSEDPVKYDFAIFARGING